MTEFQVKLLRLLTIGLTLIGGLGLSAIGYAFRLTPYAYLGFIVALVCTVYLASQLVAELVRWQISHLKPIPWEQLKAPVRTPIDSTRQS
ncbi:hypothetical protein Pan44_44400 [Caulifigura coniformis]|uniref:Uncharacterized protein n=1 Tax=Caulifigura coniformis TaxID=2527983 RepID=A0A517SJV1_9PLAN|nr:hypothetical protein [Caulifigura coniformis]QDT56386.1 hypothetical protein Pan44_44400 [Caulifigura coniformis]